MDGGDGLSGRPSSQPTPLHQTNVDRSSAAEFESKSLCQAALPTLTHLLVGSEDIAPE